MEQRPWAPVLMSPMTFDSSPLQMEKCVQRMLLVGWGGGGGSFWQMWYYEFLRRLARRSYFAICMTYDSLQRVLQVKRRLLKRRTSWQVEFMPESNQLTWLKVNWGKRCNLHTPISKLIGSTNLVPLRFDVGLTPWSNVEFLLELNLLIRFGTCKVPRFQF